MKTRFRVGLAVVCIAVVATLTGCVEATDPVVDSEAGTPNQPNPEPTPTPTNPNPNPEPNPEPSPNPEPNPEPNPSPEPVVGPTPVAGPTSGIFATRANDLPEYPSFFQQDGYQNNDVVRMDLRVVPTNEGCTVENTSGCTFNDLLADINGVDDFKVEIPSHVQIAGLTDDGEVTNAEIKQRGQFARQQPQKSFGVKLDSKDQLWRNERRFQLNKHFADNSRVRNKVAFDLMSLVPHLPSLRSQFVNLWIDSGAGPEDFGVFTHIEHVGKEYLVNRALNEDHNLYKVEFFRFSEKELAALQVDELGKPLNEEAFEGNLEIKRGEDHRALTRMLVDINDPAIDFDTVLDRYFNRNNVLMWMTVNVLLRQADAVTKNYYLYNPVGTERFYFLPWDYDGALNLEAVLTNGLSQDELVRRSYYGYARGSRNNFINKYLRQEGAHGRIVEAANYIRENYFTDAAINEIALRNTTAIAPFMTRLPDSAFDNYSENSSSRFSQIVADLHNDLQFEYGIPLHPEMDEPIASTATTLNLRWTDAYDVTRLNTSFSYDVAISTSISFEPSTIVYEANGLAGVTEHSVNRSQLPSELLFVRLVARGNADPSKYWQVALNTSRLDGREWEGILTFDNQ